MVLSSLTFMVDPIINLMSGLRHECEKRSHILHTLGISKNYSINICSHDNPTHTKSLINHYSKQNFTVISMPKFLSQLENFLKQY